MPEQMNSKDGQISISIELNGNWRSDDQLPYRTRILAQIKNFLNQRNNITSKIWFERLPIIARQLELCLYRVAPSLEAYIDESTLEHRLELLVMEISGKIPSDEDKEPPLVNHLPTQPPEEITKTDGALTQTSSKTKVKRSHCQAVFRLVGKIYCCGSRRTYAY